MKLSSANAFNLDKAKYLSFSNECTCTVQKKQGSVINPLCAFNRLEHITDRKAL